jgi:hypothetical protein
VVIVAAVAALLFGVLVLSDDDGDGGSGAAGNGGQDGGDGAAPTPTFVSELPETDEIVSPPAATPPAVELVPPPPGFSPAVPQSSESECQVNYAAIVLNWQTAQPDGDQTVDLAAHYDEFVPGRYLSTQTLAADTDSLTWNGLIPGTVYYWRVSTRLNDVWVASQSAEFETIGCPQLDEQASANWRLR